MRPQQPAPGALSRRAASRRAPRILAAAAATAALTVGLSAPAGASPAPAPDARPPAGPAAAAPRTAGTYAFDPANTFQVVRPTPNAAADENSSQFVTDSTLETEQGAALTAPLPGGDRLQVHSLGVVTRVKADGKTVWLRGSKSLMADWQVGYEHGVTFPYTPQVPAGSVAADPFLDAIDDYAAVRGSSPFAVGNLTGGPDGDIAVTETVGINLGAENCTCLMPFDVPYSDLHYGSFVTVLDARTGKTEYSRLEPGIVTQLVIENGRLLIGDETGDPSPKDPTGQWGSMSNVHAIALTTHGTATTARTAWTYSTRSKWGRLFDLRDVGDGQVALAWSDTPMGLGVPGPPDGHVVVLSATGRAQWSVRTAGYPVLSRYDATRAELAVVEQLDPVRGAGYTLAGLRIRDGRQLSANDHTAILPMTLTVGRLAGGEPTSWLVGGVHVSAMGAPHYDYDKGIVSASDPRSGSTLWTTTLANPSGFAPNPGAVALVPATSGPATVVVTSWVTQQQPSATDPHGYLCDIQALAGPSGRKLWDSTAGTPDPLSLSAVAGTRAAPGGSVQLLGVDGAAMGLQARTGARRRLGPTFTDLYAVTPVAGTDDVIAAGQSGGVYRLDTASRAMAPKWQADAGDTVHQLVSARLGTEPVVVAAATTGLIVFDENTGRRVSRVSLPDSYVWNVSIGGPASSPVIVTGTDTLSGYDLATGRRLWTYRPSVPAYFADAVVIGTVATSEYQNQVRGGESATRLGSVGVDIRTGAVRWSAPAPTGVNRAQLRAGVAAFPNPDASAPTSVAVTWETTDGAGLVEVRDAAHGTVRHSDKADALDSHNSYQGDPAFGLVATGPNGSAVVSAAGVVPIDVTGTGGAVAHVDGTPVLLDADMDLAAYPGTLLTAGGSADQIAEDAPFVVGNVVVLPDPSGSDRIVTTSDDTGELSVLNVETGLRQNLGRISIARGLAVQHLPAAAAVVAGTRRTSRSGPAERPTAVGSTGGGTGNRLHLGVGVPDVKLQAITGTGERSPADEPTAFTPAQISSYLHLTGDGAGQTVAIVDAGSDANITADADHFSRQFGLPEPCAAVANAAGCFHLDITAPDGRGAPDAGWALETSLDVEWVHAIAPRATIRLVLARGATFDQLFSAVGHAAVGSPDVISMSWGKPGGEFTDETYYDHFCALSRTVCVVSSGDSGNPGGYPAYNPAVLSVGGTALTLGADGSVADEQSWDGSGGGQSYVERRPAYQAGVLTGGRGLPDVSFDAAPETGVAVYDSVPYQGASGWFQVGGTSLSAPVWGAIVTASDQLRAAAHKGRLVSGTAQAAIYRSASALGDITSGPPNGSCPTVCTVRPGYDFITGLGSPRAGLDEVLLKQR